VREEVASDEWRVARKKSGKEFYTEDTENAEDTEKREERISRSAATKK
jgi:hypothetical protein